MTALAAVLCVWAAVVAAQVPGLNFSSSAVAVPAPTVPGSAGGAASTTGAAVATGSPRAGGSGLQTPCTPGSNVGSFFITAPNSSSFLFAGQLFNVTFSFSPAVSILPLRVDLKFASALNTEKWDTSVSVDLATANASAAGLPAGPSSSAQRYVVVWQVPESMADGAYFVRLVPDGKEIVGVPAGSLPCFADGMVVPTNSAKFIVLQPVSLVGFPDRFGPQEVASAAAGGDYLAVTRDVGANGEPTGVVTVAFNRPDTLNPMTEPMGREFTAVLGELGRDRGVRAVVLTGAGRAFSAGGDLEFLRQRTQTEPLRNAEIMRAFYELYLRPVITLPVPIIAAINGHAVGAGFCLALACDMRVASTKAKVGLNFVRIGMPPGMGGSYTLPILVGPQVAARMILTGDLVGGDEAAALGLVLRAVAPDALAGDALALARRVASASPAAVRQTVATLRMRFFDGAFERALQREADSQAICYNAPDMAEGLKAIAERRDPVFGRDAA
ncbi:hypothetical protein HK105_206709 [Polyrhizophydium stewartii]|uniref:Enoyl-CoA hydratase/isomerase family protein n=1 Tax=Polyrhizophydium stewartii TaxID=2732419 RepID=A0ABR4N2T4_9FUNG